MSPNEDGPVKVLTLYRIDDGGTTNNEVYLNLDKYSVLKKTPKGFVIDYWGTKKFVLEGDGKRFAYPTIEQAFESWCPRKRRQHCYAKRAYEWTVNAISHVNTLENAITAEQPKTANQLLDLLNRYQQFPLDGCVNLWEFA